MTLDGIWIAIALHVLCQLIYTLMMLARPLPLWKRALWLAVIWCVPIFGIGCAGARFTHLDDKE